MTDYESMIYWLKVANRKKSNALKSRVMSNLNRVRVGK